MARFEECPTCKRPYVRRQLNQNAKMWALLHDLETQVLWHGQRLCDTEWKDLLTAGLKQQRVVPGLEGGFVVLGTSTSRMPKREMSDLVDLITMFGDQRGVKWTATQRDA